MTATEHKSVAKTSADPDAARRVELEAHLRRLYPEIFTEGAKVDIDKLRAALGETANTRPERYTLTWSGKRDALTAVQHPTTGTLVPDTEKSVNWDTTRNLFIEGENLEVLKLLFKPYFGRVKMIYIDPPYNTGNDFVYPDDYSDPMGRYLDITGQRDSDGNLLTSNPETAGRYHSAWLTMMYPRLFLARQLLRDDGVIFVSIDDNEVHNLRLLMNELFGEQNFVATVIWEKKYSPQNDARWLSDNHDYVLIYARDKENWRPRLLPRTEEANARFKNPDNDPRGPWKLSDFSVRTYSAAYDYPITTPAGRVVTPPQGRSWVTSKKRFKEFVADNRIWFGLDGNNVPALKRFLSEVKPGLTSLTIWPRDEVGDTQEARRVIRDLFGNTRIFDTPKSVGLIKKMLLLSTEPQEEDIVMDFFAGSGTTAQAVLELNQEDCGNRRFILIQLPEPITDGLSNSINKTDLHTIADIGRERIKRVITKLLSESSPELAERRADMGFKFFRLALSNYKSWKVTSQQTPETYASQISLFVDPLRDGWKDQELLYEIALKEGYELNCQILRIDIANQNTFYRIEDIDKTKKLIVCLDSQLSITSVENLGLNANTLLICRSIALNDEMAANLSLQYQLKTI